MSYPGEEFYEEGGRLEEGPYDPPEEFDRRPRDAGRRSFREPHVGREGREPPRRVAPPRREDDYGDYEEEGVGFDAREERGYERRGIREYGRKEEREFGGEYEKEHVDRGGNERQFRGRGYGRGYGEKENERDIRRDEGNWDRERHRRGRSSRDLSRSRSRSRSRERGDRDRRSRKSGFDQPPPDPAAAAAAAAAAATVLPAPAAASSASVAAAAAVNPLAANPLAGMGVPGVAGMFPNMFPFAGTQQATRHARRVYVGGLPPMANEQSVAAFFSKAMALIGGTSGGSGDCVVYVYINQEKKFAFVEMRTVEEASNAMALDGVLFEGVAVRVRRPSDYNPSMAAALGPTQPNPALNLAAVGLTPGGSGGADGPDRIFVGGLPYYLTEDQIRELLSSFGPLRAFDLVKDRETGNSKGYGFCVYQDTAVTDVACMALNGMKMGDKTLTVRRATAGQAKTDQASVLAQAQQQIAMQLAAAGVGTGANTAALGTPNPPLSDLPTKVVCLNQVVNPAELSNDDDFEEILEDMKEECAKYGSVANLIIPRPGPNGEMFPGVGKVFVEYIDTTGALKARQALNGRKFGGNVVNAMFYPEERFARSDYSG